MFGPHDEARPSGSDVTLANWMTAPYNREAFQRVGELVPSARVLAAQPDGPRPVGSVAPVPNDVREVLDRTDTDAFLVLRGGEVVHEEYRNGMTPDSLHLCMSVSKSVTGAVAGVLVGRGVLDPEESVTRLVPEFEGTGMAGATVRDVLDMRTGTREEITTVEQQRAYYATAGWLPTEVARPRDPDIRTHFWRFEKEREHGGDFGYRSTLTCVLAMLMERVTGCRYPELLSDLLWQPMGAEHDAQMTVDRSGHALADIGLSCTARDLARLGELLRREGRTPDGRSVLPDSWVADILTPAPGQQAAFREAGSVFLPHPGGYYRDQWWVASPRTAPGARDGAMFALGIHGQLLYVDEAAELVVVKFSSWADTWDTDRARATYELCARLGADPSPSW